MNDQELTHISLFSGIGGFDIAGEWAGFRTVVFCEKDEFCQKVLQKHWPEIPIIPEIRDFDGTKWRGATLLTGGFPCQPFSVAGQRRGKEDDRYLWPEMLRIIKEAKSRWILAENVPGIFRMALDTVLADLESEGYTTGTFIIPACGLNAPHRRNRVWIIAYYGISQPMELSGGKQKCRDRISNGHQNTLDSASNRSSPRISRQKPRQKGNTNIFNDSNSHAQDTLGARARSENRTTDDKKGQARKSRREGIRQRDGEIGTGRLDSTNSDAPNSQCLGRQEGSRKRTEYEKQVSKRQDFGDGNSKGTTPDSEGRVSRKQAEQKRGEDISGGNIETFADSNSRRNGRHQRKGTKEKTVTCSSWQEDWYEVAARFCGMAHGVPDRVHRLKALGNAIVPQIAYEILKNIAWIENERVAD